MKVNCKKILWRALIVTLCVFVIVLILCLLKKENEYNQKIAMNQKQIQEMEKQLEELSEKNVKLEENLAEFEKIEKELREKLLQVSGIQGGNPMGSDLMFSQQAFSDLKAVFELYLEGKTDEAKKAFDKINTMGFDDNVLSYYELLSCLLNKQ